MSIYVMRAGLYFKIGYTAGDGRKRHGTIQTSSPLPVYLLGVIDGSEADEDRLHKRYAAKRMQGEWFALSWSDVGDILGGSDDEPEPESISIAEVLGDCWLPELNPSADRLTACVLTQIEATWPADSDVQSAAEILARIARPGNWWRTAFPSPEAAARFLGAIVLRSNAGIPFDVVEVDGQQVAVFARSDIESASNSDAFRRTP